MKKIFLIALVLFSTTNCSKDKINNANPYIPNYSFVFDINLDLPEFNELKFPSNAKLITYPGVGANGIIVFNTGSGYTAFDANCPNHYLSDCSRMVLKGILAKCPCDDLEYDLYSGTKAGQPYTMKAYRVEVTGNNIRVFN